MYMQPQISIGDQSAMRPDVLTSSSASEEDGRKRRRHEAAAAAGHIPVINLTAASAEVTDAEDEDAAAADVARADDSPAGVQARRLEPTDDSRTCSCPDLDQCCLQNEIMDPFI